MAKAKGETVTEAPAKKKHMIDENGVAVSPLPDYPGSVTFPVPPKGGTYSKFTAAAKRRPDEDDADFMRLKPHWRGTTAIAEIAIEGVDSLEFDDVDLDVIRWVANATDEYLHRFFQKEL